MPDGQPGQAQEQSHATPESLAKQIDDIEEQLLQLLAFLQRDGQACAHAVSRLLDDAFEESYQLSRSLNGNYDKRLDVEQSGLHTSVLRKFEMVQQKSDEGFKALCSAQARGFDLRDNTLKRIADAAKSCLLTMTSERDGVQRSIYIAIEGMETMRRARSSAEDAKKALEDKAWHTGASKVAANVGFGIVTFGIWSIIGAINPDISCTTVVGLEHASREIDQQISEHNASIASIEQDLRDLEARQARYRERTAVLLTLLEKISSVEESLEQKVREIDNMAHRIVAAKAVATPICLRLVALTARATTVARHCMVQKEYADAVLDLCQIGNMDKRRARIIERVVGEVRSYPAVRQSESLTLKLQEADAKCQQQLSGSVVDRITW